MQLLGKATVTGLLWVQIVEDGNVTREVTFVRLAYAAHTPLTFLTLGSMRQFVSDK